MPKLKNTYYQMTGYATVKTFSQAEMAAALGLTETRLVGAIKQGIGLAYHRKPANSGYEFNHRCYVDNQRIWACYRDGDHNYQADDKYWYLPLGADTCSTCGHTRYG